ncbi:Spo0B domain-containing protein [Virgibacillus doumboii]|uniref:Spo0B domain-containing protein n=1 Tax=Virgibacillus doumboii TaxID=2697503 RepID=UPI0013DF925B|nr:Spo0B domain-containing protein [Virgibacillus doumboii]
MEEKEVIQILRQYRHDLLNQLQIVQGYMSMGKTEKVQSKIKDYIQRLNEERKLVNFDAPLFALYLIQFDSLHMNFRLTYDIHTENRNLQHIDGELIDCCRKIMAEIEHISDENELYEVHLQINEVASESLIELDFAVVGNFYDSDNRLEGLKNNRFNADTDITADGITCTCNVQF